MHKFYRNKLHESLYSLLSSFLVRLRSEGFPFLLFGDLNGCTAVALRKNVVGLVTMRCSVLPNFVLDVVIVTVRRKSVMSKALRLSNYAWPVSPALSMDSGWNLLLSEAVSVLPDRIPLSMIRILLTLVTLPFPAAFLITSSLQKSSFPLCRSWLFSPSFPVFLTTARSRFLG